MAKEDKEFILKMKQINDGMSLESRMGDLKRARSVTVGTAFGGTTELMLRGNDGSVLWSPMQPVEVIELIHQLAANVGCHLALQPREDFSSWRNWNVTEQERIRMNGWPPFPNDMAPFIDYGKQPGDKRLSLGSEQKAPTAPVEIPAATGRVKNKKLNIQSDLKDVENDNTVATKKIINQRKSKRAPTTS